MVGGGRLEWLEMEVGLSGSKVDGKENVRLVGNHSYKNKHRNEVIVIMGII